MKLPQTGGCQCGKIRYEITDEPQLVYTCRCLDCQRLTSSAFSLGSTVVMKKNRWGPPRLEKATCSNCRHGSARLQLLRIARPLMQSLI